MNSALHIVIFIASLFSPQYESNPGLLVSYVAIDQTGAVVKLPSCPNVAPTISDAPQMLIHIRGTETPAQLQTEIVAAVTSCVPGRVHYATYDYNVYYKTITTEILNMPVPQPAPAPNP